MGAPPDVVETAVSAALLLAGFMVVDDLLPYCRLGVEWLTVLVEDRCQDLPLGESLVIARGFNGPTCQSPAATP